MEGGDFLKCSNCGGKMVKWKYLHYEELEAYLLSELKWSGNIVNYEEWLRALKQNDLVLTLFRRENFSGIKEKYCLRVVEQTTKAGIKLRHLTRIFRYEVGEIEYGKKDKINLITTYKIVSINEQVDKIIRDYCKDKEQFDIDKLNKIVTKALS